MAHLISATKTVALMTARTVAQICHQNSCTHDSPNDQASCCRRKLKRSRKTGVACISPLQSAEVEPCWPRHPVRSILFQASVKECLRQSTSKRSVKAAPETETSPADAAEFRKPPNRNSFIATCCFRYRRCIPVLGCPRKTRRVASRYFTR